MKCKEFKIMYKELRMGFFEQMKEDRLKNNLSIFESALIFRDTINKVLREEFPI